MYELPPFRQEGLRLSPWACSPKADDFSTLHWGNGVSVCCATTGAALEVLALMGDAPPLYLGLL